jgi:acyl-CoA synthetase (AMP-forming)/AMP-acid ligase II
MLLAANLNGNNLLLEQQADIAGVLRLLVDRKVTHAVLVPTVLQRLLALPEAGPPTGARSATSATGPR